MFGTLKRSFKTVCIVAITLLFLAFAINNRQVVNISLFPLPYDADLPLFLLAILCFGGGVIIGGITASIRYSKAKRQAKAERHRIEALENELRAMHSQRPALPALAHKA